MLYLAFSVALMMVFSTKISMAAEEVDRIYIVVDTESITWREFELERQQLELQQNAISIEDKAVVAKTTTNAIIDGLLLQNQGKILKISIPEDRIDERIKQILKSSPNIRNVYSDDQLRKIISDGMLRQAVLQREVMSRIVVRPSEIIQECQADGGESELKVGHIVIFHQEPQAEEKIKEIQNMLKEGADFEEMAILRSSDPQAKNTRGILGYIKKGSLYPEFEAVAFATKIGEISDYFSTPLGYHIVKVYEQQKSPNSINCNQLSPSEYITFETRLHDKKFEAERIKYMEKLRDKAYIRIIN